MTEDEIYDEMTRTYPYFYRWRRFQGGEEGGFTGDRLAELNDILAHFKSIPGLWGFSLPWIYKRMGDAFDVDNLDDETNVKEMCRQLVVDWFHGRCTAGPGGWPKLWERVKQESKSRNGQDGKALEKILQAHGWPLVGSTELSEMWSGSAIRAGQVMKALNYTKRRVTGSGDNQSIWVIANQDHYDKLSPKELREAWLNQSSASEVSFM